MRWFCFILLCAGLAKGSATEDFIARAKADHGEAGARAAAFLVENMPEADRGALSADFLTRNLDLAFAARAEFPWAAKVPEEIFLNDVLPYAVFDETREPWREDFLAKARPIVKDAKTATEAAQALNQHFFKLVNVHYNTGRKAPNQSPSESMASGRATCSGLSIILVDACRAVGIPARAAGTPMWTNGRGNHTWVEIWDGGWHFTGADEYDAKGLNRGWFTGDAAKADAANPIHGIYATSWKKDKLTFPMVWAPRSTTVPGVDVTSRYAKPAGDDGMARLGIRLRDGEKGVRLVASVRAFPTGSAPSAAVETLAGTADLNDMPRIVLPPGTAGKLRFTRDGETREMDFGPLDKGESTVDADWSKLAVSQNSLPAGG